MVRQDNQQHQGNPFNLTLVLVLLTFSKFRQNWEMLEGRKIDKLFGFLIRRSRSRFWEVAGHGFHFDRLPNFRLLASLQLALQTYGANFFVRASLAHPAPGVIPVDRVVFGGDKCTGVEEKRFGVG